MKKFQAPVWSDFFASFAPLGGQPSAIRPARSAVTPTWAGKPMPRGTGFPARGFGAGHTPSALRPPITPFPPVKNSSVCSVCSVGQPSAVRPQSSAVRLPPSAVPSDSCVFCASLRPTLGHPPTRRVQHPNIPEGETILPAPKQSPPPSLLRLLFTRVPARALEVSWPRIGSISTSAEKNDPLIGLLYLFRDSTSSWRKSAAVGSHSPRMAASPADSYLPPGRGRSVANGGSP